MTGNRILKHISEKFQTYHHFRFDATKPGLVSIKEFPSTEEKTIKIMKNQCILHFEGIPLVLNPRGLVAERA